MNDMQTREAPEGQRHRLTQQELPAVTDQNSHSIGDERLATPGRGCYPSRLVDRETEIVALGVDGITGVETQPDPIATQ